MDLDRKRAHLLAMHKMQLLVHMLVQRSVLVHYYNELEHNLAIKHRSYQTTE